LKVNFHKSEVFFFGKAKDDENSYRIIFGCEVGSLPFKYLGILIHYRTLLNKEWKPIEDRFEKKLASFRQIALIWGPISANQFRLNKPADVPSMLFFDTNRGKKEVRFQQVAVFLAKR
jgi:hypothetical protein